MKTVTLEHLSNVENSLSELLKSIPILSKLTQYATRIAYGALGLQAAIWIIQKFILEFFVDHNLFSFLSNYSTISHITSFLTNLGYISFLAMELGLVLLLVSRLHKDLLYSILGFVAYQILYRINWSNGMSFTINFRGVVDILCWLFLAYLIKGLMDYKGTQVENENSKSCDV